MQDLPTDARRCDKVESRSHAGTPNMRVDTHSIAYHANTAGNTKRRVSTGPADAKPLDLPTRGAMSCQDGTDGLESCPDTHTLPGRWVQVE